MSVSLNNPLGGPSVAELLLERAFRRPPQPFVDADVILALSAAAHDRPLAAPAPPPRAPTPAPTPDQGPQVDIRA